jgi:hypothetical protein
LSGGGRGGGGDRNGPLDRELKPNAKIRDELNVCSFPRGALIAVTSADKARLSRVR